MFKYYLLRVCYFVCYFINTSLNFNVVDEFGKLEENKIKIELFFSIANEVDLFVVT